MEKFDVIVVGLGAMGSATVYQLSKRGSKVLGIDRYSPPHVQGSTHGETRITRLAIGEGEEYVPLAIRSHQIWREIEEETGKELRFRVGGLIISSPESRSSCHVTEFFDRTVDLAKSNGIAHECLDATDIRNKFPQFKVANEEVGYFEYEAGYLIPEECVKTQLDLAKKQGAVLHTGETVLEFKSDDGSEVTVITENGTYTAEDLVVTAGPWLPELIGMPYSSEFKVSRQVLYWFDIENRSRERFAPQHCPVFIWDLQDRDHGIYGFPAVNGPDGGVKIATEQDVETTTPQTIERNVTEKEKSEMYERFVEPFISGLTGKCLDAVTCMYTSRANARFLIDRHPEYKNIFIVSPCSGHGFKHSAAIGEAVAQDLSGEKVGLDLSGFSFYG